MFYLFGCLIVFFLEGPIDFDSVLSQFIFELIDVFHCLFQDICILVVLGFNGFFLPGDKS